MMGDYEDDWDSQKLAHTIYQRLRRLNRMLMGLHNRINENLHPEGFLTILETLHETKEIILDMENTFFSHRRKRTFRKAMPDIHNVTKQKKEEKKSDEE